MPEETESLPPLPFVPTKAKDLLYGWLLGGDLDIFAKNTSVRSDPPASFSEVRKQADPVLAALGWVEEDRTSAINRVVLAYAYVERECKQDAMAALSDALKLEACADICLIRALLLDELGSAQTAIMEVDDILQDAPELASAVFVRGLLLAHRGDYANALRTFRSADDLGFESAGYHVVATLEIMGDLQAARTAANTLLREERCKAELLHAALAHANVRLKNRSASVKSIDAALAEAPDKHWLHFWAQDMFKHLNLWEREAEQYGWLAEHCRGDARSLYLALQGWGWWKKKSDAKRSEQLISKAIEVDPENANAWVFKRHLCYDRASYEEAVAAASLVIAIKGEPEDPQDFRWLGLAHAALKQFDEAENAFKKSLYYDRSVGCTHSDFGAVLFRKQRYEEAVKYFEESVALAPDHVLHHINRALCMILLERWSEAISSCNTAVALEPHTAHHYLILAHALDGAGRFDEALKSYEYAQQLEPMSPDAAIGEAYTALRKGDKERAKAAAFRAVRFSSKSRSAWAALGTVYALDSEGSKKELMQNAIVALTRALELPDELEDSEERSSGYYLYRGYAYANSGLYKKALQDFETAHRLAAEGSQVWVRAEINQRIVQTYLDRLNVCVVRIPTAVTVVCFVILALLFLSGIERVVTLESEQIAMAVTLICCVIVLGWNYYRVNTVKAGELELEAAPQIVLPLKPAFEAVSTPATLVDDAWRRYFNPNGMLRRQLVMEEWHV
jgi:tetratricopeptide (TPR) repeat protein